jgi:hypothetical protein
LSQSPDDEYQVVIAAAPVAPPRRPRTPNPVVDEAIQSGEIELPRSLIIRSSASPPLQREEDRTEPTLPPRQPTAPVRARRFGRIAWLVAAVAPALAAIVLQVAQPAAKPATTVPHTGETDTTVQLVAVTLDGEVHAAQLRAEAIATSSMLRAGIQTDAATLNDMARDKDMVFSLAPGERAEVFQAGGVSLLRVPAGGAAIENVVANTALLEVQGNTTSIVVSAPITKQDGTVAGVIALATPIDVSRLKGGHFEQLTGVTLTGLGAPVALGGGSAAPNGIPIKQPIATSIKGATLAINATLAAPVVTNNDQLLKTARYACAVLATLFVLMYLGSVILRR